MVSFTKNRAAHHNYQRTNEARDHYSSAESCAACSQASFGGVAGRFDYVGSVMGRSRDGFREHSQENTERLFGAAGYRFNEYLENRFYLTLDHVDRQLPGGLTKQELDDNPQQANPAAVTEDFNKKWNLIRVADKISFRNDGKGDWDRLPPVVSSLFSIKAAH